jgi:hypothetical protein
MRTLHRKETARRWAILGLVALVGCKDDGSADGDGDGGSDAGADSTGVGTGGSAGTGSSGADSGTTGAPEDPGSAVDDARLQLPTYLDLHQQVFYRTCTPNEGVCHNDKEYPDLRTPQSMLGAIGMPCNIALDDPMTTFNGCEVPGDTFAFLYSANDGFESEIAYVEMLDGVDGPEPVLHLRDAIPNAMADPAGTEGFTVSRPYDDGAVQLAQFYSAYYEQGSTEIHLRDYAMIDENYRAFLETELVVGDPNRDGVFGAQESGFALIAPGDPASSYLLGRVLGNVPGTPMPLANQPLSSAEMIALVCWIEGLDAADSTDVYAAIDYNNCDAAKTFGEPQPDSGHSLSNDVQPIFDQYCTAGGCHAAEAPAAGLDLTPGRARSQLLGPASQDAAAELVLPGNPTSSYLMLKLEGKGASGLQMPRTAYGDGAPLPEASIAIVEQWIIAGAPDD